MISSRGFYSVEVLNSQGRKADIHSKLDERMLMVEIRAAAGGAEGKGNDFSYKRHLNDVRQVRPDALWNPVRVDTLSLLQASTTSCPLSAHGSQLP